MTKSPAMQAADSFALFAKAKAAAEAAMLAAFEKDERRDTGACGFAWVELRPATHPFVRWMKANGQGDKHWHSGWWYSIQTSHPTQGLHVKEAGARAFADTISAEALSGLEVHSTSRVD
jgi:hypothetical protein